MWLLNLTSSAFVPFSHFAYSSIQIQSFFNPLCQWEKKKILDESIIVSFCLYIYQLD